MDRKLFKFPFSPERGRDWICPSCEKGVLRIKPDTFHKDEIASSKAAHSADEWEPEWAQYVYTCLLNCTNDQCGEVVVSAGIGSLDSDVEEDEHGWQHLVYSPYFRPKYFEPHLKIVKVPRECPDSVSEALNESFKLFLVSPSAAANSIRIAIEELLTELKVKRYVTSNGSRRIINLHQRIGLIPKKYEHLKELIYAVKWLGNAGSHNHQGVTLDDVMDAYELSEHILQELYDPKANKLKVLAKKVNKKKGPAK